MKIEKLEDKVVVELEGERINYGEEMMQEENFLTSEGVKNLREWEIDLVKNHGVDVDEL